MDVCCCDVAIMVFISFTDGAYLSLIENGQEAELNDIPKDRAQEMINSSTRMGWVKNTIIYMGDIRDSQVCHILTTPIDANANLR